MIAIDGVDGLVGDISGVAHLFGGEPDLRADLNARFARVNLSAVTAIAGSRGAAHALVRYGGGIVPAGHLNGGYSFAKPRLVERHLARRHLGRI